MALASGCGGGTAAPAPPPPVPSPVSVSITPLSGSVLLGNKLTFSATVSNTSNQQVTWLVNGVTGGSSATGTISADGVYTAPSDLPATANAQVTARSVVDAESSASVQVSIVSDVAIALTPGAAGVELGASLPLRASISSNSHPDMAVRWSLSGAACPMTCGSLDASGVYTAPPMLPAATGVSVVITSVADPSKQATASLTVTSNFSLQLAAPTNVSVGGTVILIATLMPVPGSNPSPQLTWSLTGTGCSGSSCGLLTATTQAIGSNAIPDTATYTAPAIAPSPSVVTISVTPQADQSKRVQAVVAIQAGVSVNVAPSTATLAANHRLTLSAQVSGTANTGLQWSVNGLSGGSATVGFLCVVNSNPCQAVTGGSSLEVDYIAPGSIPSPNPVTVQATSVADPTRSATTQITVINHVVVSVQPASVLLAPRAVQAFTATVLGSSIQSVVWQVQGSGCVVNGVCGMVDANGIYSAPASAPNPSTLQVIAISSDDVSQFGAANITVASGPNIQTLAPASVYAGAANGFTLRVDGSGFLASSAGPGSSLLIGGVPRTTTCATGGECTTPIFAADTATASTVSVQIQNPDGSKSNSVSLVVVAPSPTDASVSLTTSAPEAAGKDIVVVEPTTAGVSAPNAPLDLNVGALGVFSIANNSCTLAGNPIVIARPASGASTTDICVFSQSGLDTSMTYGITGPGDVTAVARQPAGLGIIHLTLQVQAGAQAGARTLFVQNTNLDKTAATGALEVQ